MSDAAVVFDMIGKMPLGMMYLKRIRRLLSPIALLP